MSDAAEPKVFEHFDEDTPVAGGIPDDQTQPAPALPPQGREIAPGRTVGLPSSIQTNPRDFQIKTGARNKLMEAAMPLLGLAVRIRGLHEFDGIEALHARLVNEMQGFQQEIEMAGYDDATVLASRYIMCSAVDEAVLSRPWGADSNWPERPLLSVYHNETWGGEKVFAILDRVMDESHRFVDLLELTYYVVALGFEGRYHVMHNGQSRLDALLGSVQTLLEKHRGPVPERLMNPDPNIYETRQRMTRQFPVWGIWVIAGLLLVSLHLIFDWRINTEIDRIENEIGTSLSLTTETEEGIE